MFKMEANEQTGAYQVLDCPESKDAENALLADVHNRSLAIRIVNMLNKSPISNTKDIFNKVAELICQADDLQEQMSMYNGVYLASIVLTYKSCQSEEQRKSFKKSTFASLESFKKMIEKEFEN